MDRWSQRGFARLRSTALALFSALLLVAGSLGLVHEIRGKLKVADPSADLPPSAWLLAQPQVEPLREFLERVDRRLPADAVVWVESDRYADGELFFLATWVSYSLPRQYVSRRGKSPPSQGYLLRFPAPAEISPTEVLRGVAVLERLP